MNFALNSTSEAKKVSTALRFQHVSREQPDKLNAVVHVGLQKELVILCSLTLTFIDSRHKKFKRQFSQLTKVILLVSTGQNMYSTWLVFLRTKNWLFISHLWRYSIGHWSSGKYTVPPFSFTSVELNEQMQCELYWNSMWNKMKGFAVHEIAIVWTRQEDWNGIYMYKSGRENSRLKVNRNVHYKFSATLGKADVWCWRL